VLASSLEIPSSAAHRLTLDVGGVSLLEWFGETSVLLFANLTPADHQT
jgi:hypothetical protein